MVLEVRELRFAYRKDLVLDGVNLNLNAREILILLGPNGCGKSTLLKCINKILKPFGGVVLLDGKEILKMEEKEVSKLFGYVPQDHKPPFPYKVIDFVLLGRTPHIGLFSTPSKRDYEIAMESLRIVGIESFADRAYTELSGGERQLVLIARALASEAKILLLDEPTAHLDFKNTHRVLETIRRLVKERNLSTIITLHDPNLAQRYGDRIALVHNRKIECIGFPEEVITEELIRRVYGVEVELLSTNGFRFVVPKVVR
uniref:ABC transporter ATP-binding protein n=1 Tax=Archaeoglobus fulgidus TaxID=2234 RepID=A0A7J3M307_ARCFL